VLGLRTTTPDSALQAAGADWIVTDCSHIYLHPVGEEEDLLLELR
jgi:hypothetical protein